MAVCASIFHPKGLSLCLGLLQLSSTAAGAKSFTIDMWVRFSSSTDQGIIVAITDTGDATDIPNCGPGTQASACDEPFVLSQDGDRLLLQVGEAM